MRKCLSAVAAFVMITGSAQANADDEVLHVGPYCISHDENGSTSENFVTACLIQVDGDQIFGSQTM